MKKYSFIAVIGPDGSGKTTLVDGIKDELVRIGYKNIHHRAANFEILPTFSEMRNILRGGSKKSRNTEGFKGFHSGMQQQPNSILKSILLVLWYSIDLNLGRTKIKEAKKEGSMYFFARYFYDYYFQIANKNVPRSFLNVILKLIPKPEVVFYISRSAEDIYEKKPELSLDEIKRQQRIIESLCDEHDNFFKLDSSKGVDEMISNACSYIKSR